MDVGANRGLNWQFELDHPELRRAWAMPTVLRVGPYRFFFYSGDGNEPAHVHVDRDALSAKFWLQPVALARNLGFRPAELRRIRRILMEHEARLLDAWHDFFGT